MANPADSATKTLDDLMLLAIAQDASDIHFETGDRNFRVRFRIDGVLCVKATPALHLRDAIISRLKVQARMDIAEKRIPQDGRIQYQYQNQIIDMRVSSLPTVHGEKIVVRILKFSQKQLSLAELGYEKEQLVELIQVLQKPQGLILMTGPTGSGKTLSLYSCLAMLNRSDLNVSTVEDPSEIHLPGANQVSINPKAGLTFASTLRALLRQDPDVIMVGEIRDLETAEIAIQASQTGHLVLSTLHTNDAPATLTRLQHMGVEAFNIAASVSLIIAQRLLRRLCDGCKRPFPTESIDGRMKHEWSTLSVEMQPSHIYQAVGCHRCDQGYKGRIGLFQVMPVSEPMQALILDKCNALALTQQSKFEGVLTLRESGWLKVFQGVTSADEVLRITPND